MPRKKKVYCIKFIYLSINIFQNSYLFKVYNSLVQDMIQICSTKSLLDFTHQTKPRWEISLIGQPGQNACKVVLKNDTENSSQLPDVMRISHSYRYRIRGSKEPLISLGTKSSSQVEASVPFI